jgi:hypothetical protein
MRALGFTDIRCGKDGPTAWAIADQWNKRWQATRAGQLPPPISEGEDVGKDTAELARVYPPGSVGAAFQRYIKTDEWKESRLSTRQKVIWPAWFRIRDTFGDVDPNAVTFEAISAWRRALAGAYGLNVSFKALKFWRKLWRVMSAMKIARGADPSTSIVNVAPSERWQTWNEGEAVILVKTAIRRRFYGLAAAIAVVWDTQFQPGDARTLRARHMVRHGGRLVFDRREEGRQKTGKAIVGTLSRRTERLVFGVLEHMDVELTGEAFLFRTRSGNPYRDDTLADDFAEMRGIAFPGDKRQLRDMRRAGTVEAIVGGARTEQIGPKMGNSIQRSNKLWKTYVPLEIEPVLMADEHRKVGRAKLRGQNKDGQRVTTYSPVVSQPRKSPSA